MYMVGACTALVRSSLQLDSAPSAIMEMGQILLNTAYCVLIATKSVRGLKLPNSDCKVVLLQKAEESDF